MSRCLADGLLTGTDGLLGPEPFDHAFPAMAVAVACNHLRCRSCGKIVRAIDGYTFVSDLHARVAEAFAQPDAWLVQQGLLQPLAAVRTYLCACTAFSTSRIVYLDDEEPLAPNPPWQCDGHPDFAPPALLDGERIADDTDFTALLARAWAEQLAPSAAPWQGEWPSRLYALLEPGPLAARVADAALACLVHPEAQVAVRAALFFATHATLPQAGRLPEAYARDPAHFARTQNAAAAGHDLRFWLLQSVARRLFEVGPDDAATLAFARAMATAPGDKPLQLLGGLRKLDADWVHRNAPALAAANPGESFD